MKQLKNSDCMNCVTKYQQLQLSILILLQSKARPPSSYEAHVVYVDYKPINQHKKRRDTSMHGSICVVPQLNDSIHYLWLLMWV